MFVRSIVKQFVLASLLALVATAVLADDAIDVPATTGIMPFSAAWISPGFYSYHFQEHENFRSDNVGICAQADVTPAWSAGAGSFINSDRARSHYVGAFWQPLELGALRAGLFAGGINGYPRMLHGNWFGAAMPVASVEHDRLGLNMTILPNYANRLHGAFVLQFIVKVW
jgi:hypothetical protein